MVTTGCTGARSLRRAAGSSLPSRDFLLRNVSVFDGERVIDTDSVRVAGGRIAAAAGTAVASGVDVFAHVPLDRQLTTHEVEAVRAAGTCVVATLSVQSTIGCGPHAGALRDDPLVAPFLTAGQRRNLGRTFGRCRPVLLEYAIENVRLLHRAGVPILAGTDAPNPGTAFGASMLGELGLLAEAGLAPAEALAAATAQVAEAFGLPDRGRIAPGLRADLLLVPGDPVTDIAAIRDIAGIWKNGFPVSRVASGWRRPGAPPRRGPPGC